MNPHEELLAVHLKELGIAFKREVRLNAKRRFRWDFVVENFAIEIQGGTFVRGGHTRGKQYRKDCEKMRLAIEHGYVPVHFTTDEVSEGVAQKWISQMVNQHLKGCAANTPGWKCDLNCKEINDGRSAERRQKRG